MAPISPVGFPSANAALASFPTKASPTLGSLQGKGVYTSKLAYELQGASASTQQAILASFVGLITSNGIFQAWMSGLWHGQYGQILSAWGHRTNVVLANGVEFGGFTPAVIGQNSR